MTVVHGEPLSMDDLFIKNPYPWLTVVHGEPLSMVDLSKENPYLWMTVVHGESLSMDDCCSWRALIHGWLVDGEPLSMEDFIENPYPWLTCPWRSLIDRCSSITFDHGLKQYISCQVTTTPINPTDEGKLIRNHGLGTYLTTEKTKLLENQSLS